MYQTIAAASDLDQTVMLAHMVAALQEREQYEVHIRETFPKLTTIHEPVFVGSFTWTCQQEKWKILQSKNAISTPAGWASPAELARNYITIKYPKRRRVTTDQYHEIMKPRSQPLLAHPGTYGDCVYLDLKSAYWSILKVIGWDVEYFPGRWLGVRSDVSDYPFQDFKLARNSLVSVGLVGRANYWTGDKLISVRKSNGLVNMALWSAVQDILNGIALDMEKAGALYINTDGYIFRSQAAELAYEVAESWGLVLGEKERGAADILAAGTYSIGMKPNRRTQMIKPTYHRKIAEVDNQWLRPRMLKFSQYRRSNKVD
jgi:hypothetical protein